MLVNLEEVLNYLEEDDYDESCDYHIKMIDNLKKAIEYYEKENEKTNWEKALIDEIDDVLHDNYEDYETGIGLSEETKLDIAKDICETYDWEDLRMTIMEKINEALKERLNYLRSLDNCTTLDPRGEDYRELCVLNDWERGDL